MIRRLAFIGVSLAALFAIGLPIAPRLGWATPFANPSKLYFRGRDYLQPGCERSLKANERPLRKVGSVFGWFTLPESILIPHYESALLTAQGKLKGTPAVLYVRGSCLAVYGLSGGP